MTSERVAVFAFGTFFVVIMLIVAVAIPTPTELQWRVFNLVLALSGGAVTAFLPGVFQFRLTPWLRAGGSLAVFALIYLVKPAALVASDPLSPLPKAPPVEQAKEVIDKQLKRIDAAQYEEAFDASASAWKSLYKKDDFVKLSMSLRQPLGAVQFRREYGQNAQQDRVQRLHVHTVTFLTQFANMTAPIRESVWVVAKDESTGWQPAGYIIDVLGAQSSQGAQSISGSAATK